MPETTEPNPIDAITTKLVEIFEPLGLKVKVTLQYLCLDVVVISIKSIPKQEPVTAIVKKIVEGVDLGTIERVVVYGRNEKAWAWAWRSKIPLSIRSRTGSEEDELVLENPLKKEGSLIPVFSAVVILIMFAQCVSNLPQHGCSDPLVQKAQNRYDYEYQRGLEKRTVDRDTIDSSGSAAYNLDRAKQAAGCE